MNLGLMLIRTAFVFVGILISLLVLLHDVNRRRMSFTMPQAAPSRLPPELHVLAAILDGTGWVFLRSWSLGFIVLLAHLGITLGLAPWFIERFALWLAKKLPGDF